MKSEWTEDFFFNGKIQILQNRHGYRISVDSYLLLQFVVSLNQNRIKRCIEFGIGSGFMSIGLILSECVEKILGLEIQESLFNLAKENIKRNLCENEIEIVNCDIRDKKYGFEKADIIVMNPPFWEENRKQREKNVERKIACHEIKGKIEDWIKRAKELLKNRKGKMYLIYPAHKLDKIFSSLSNHGFSPQNICFIHSFRNKNAELVLVESRLGKKENVNIMCPIILKTRNGKDTKKMSKILDGKFYNKIRDRKDLREKKIKKRS